MESQLANYKEYKGTLKLKEETCDMILCGLNELHDLRVGTP